VSAEALLFVVFHNVVMFFEHRALHTPFLFRALHSVHHSVIAPSPFDDVIAHPLEISA
jgi:sterol desaturase/sphingolipid hydroxylase (fatty acid hydroxylase superfamily)